MGLLNVFMLPNDAILIQTLRNLGQLKEGNPEFSPTGDNGSSIRQRCYLNQLFCHYQLDMSGLMIIDSL